MDSKNKLQEPAFLYTTTTELTSNAMVALLGGNSILKLGKSLASDFDILELTRRGIPKKSLVALSKKISFTFQELANIMHISERTLQRFEDDVMVKTEYSEKVIELAKLYARGEEVFGSLERFKVWMKTPSLFFKNDTPLSLLDTSIGFNLVFNELGRIEQGIFA